MLTTQRQKRHLFLAKKIRVIALIFLNGQRQITMDHCSFCAHHALLAEEEATALSTWAVACICGSMRLEHILTLFAGALLEKQTVVLCSNLGILSASVLSIIPLIRPYRWQSLLMPILPDDMLDFLDAPVPYIVSFIFQLASLSSSARFLSVWNELYLLCKVGGFCVLMCALVLLFHCLIQANSLKANNLTVMITLFCLMLVLTCSV
ncbi:hypothetical protein POPTR_018G065501v4 [Populus trichocarpa]|uniref:UDENN domain-containing protein n=1 Tax=Populus trichocarpa TaxID=3694 RepID=A0A3N7H8Y0_POPTR|nr:uncharacterized protein LOC18107700 isoform X2 [Populus trichocarpa]RQP02762.1 hypothetical protein POPTR_018G065501v4 [Populus trichocarpa]|eukprot:XP_024445318.1 uncharacterized protein LOC18107700 isoform X2 [Populus trichocarpa]